MAFKKTNLINIEPSYTALWGMDYEQLNSLIDMLISQLHELEISGDIEKKILCLEVNLVDATLAEDKPFNKDLVVISIRPEGRLTL